MKKVLSMFILCSIIFTSCQQKEVQEETILYPEGFFTVKNELYFSDGKRFYCSFENWEHLYSLRGNKEAPKATILNYDKLPGDMRLIKRCNVGILTPKFYE